MKTLANLKISKPQLETLAKNMRVLLDEHQLTEAALANELGIPLMTVRRIVFGETTDPRISTLKLFADYFKITVDELLDPAIKSSNKASHPIFIPILTWDSLITTKSFNELDLKSWKAWHPIALNDQLKLSNKSFALESKSSMQPRFPKGTLFIIDTEEKAIDSDMVLVKIKSGGELSLRELIIDAPKWQLQPVIPGSESFFYSSNKHQIVGVVMLTLLQARH